MLPRGRRARRRAPDRFPRWGFGASGAASLAVAVVLLAAAAAPAAAEAGTLRARRRQGRHHAAHGLLPRRLDARRPPRRRRSTRASSRARSCSSATAARSRSSASTCSWSPAGMVEADRRRARRARVLRAEHPHLAPRTPTPGPGGYAQLPDAQHRRAEPADRSTDPLSFVAPAQPRARRPAALPLPRRADRRGDRARRRRPRARGGRRGAPTRSLGLTRNRSLEAHLANHGIIEDARRGQRERRRPGGYAAHDRPDGRRPARRQARPPARAQDARRVPIGAWSHVRRPRHGHQVVVPVLQRATTTPRRCGCSRQACARRARCPPARRCVNVYGNSERGRHVRRPRPPRPGGVGLRRPRRGRGDAARLEARRAPARPRTPALDLRWTRVCFCGQQVDGAAGGHRVGGRAPVPDRLRGGARTAVRRHRRALRGAAAAPISLARRTARKLRLPGVGAACPTKRAAARRPDRPADDRLAPRRGRPRRSARGSKPRSAQRRRVGHRERRRVRAWRTSSSSTSRRPRSTTASTTRAATPTSAASPARSCSSELANARRARSRAASPRRPPSAFDPTNGVTPDGPAYGHGAASGTITAQPAAAYGRLQRAQLVVAGRAAGPRPAGRPRVRDRAAARAAALDHASTTTSGWRCCGGRRRRAATTCAGRSRATRRAGTYRLVVTAKRYRLESRPFRVGGTRGAEGRAGAGARRPRRGGARVPGGGARRRPDPPAALRERRRWSCFRVGGATVRVARKRGTVFCVTAPAGTPVSVAPRARARPLHNVNGPPAQIR